MKKIIKTVITCTLLFSCLMVLPSCSGKKQYTALEGYWIIEDDTTSVIVAISVEKKNNYITFLDNTLEAKAITATFKIEGKDLVITCTTPDEMKYLGGTDNTLITPYVLSEDGLSLTLTYAGKTVNLTKFTKDLSNVPNLDQIK